MFVLAKDDSIAPYLADLVAPTVAMIALAMSSHLMIAQVRARRRLHQITRLTARLAEAPQAIAGLERQLDSLERHVDSLPDSQAMATELKVLQGLMSNLQRQQIDRTGLAG